MVILSGLVDIWTGKVYWITVLQLRVEIPNDEFYIC